MIKTTQTHPNQDCVMTAQFLREDVEKINALAKENNLTKSQTLRLIVHSYFSQDGNALNFR